MPLPAGWSWSRSTPSVRRAARPSVEVPSSRVYGALNDYSALSYRDAWDRFFARVRETYPFGDEKRIDWDAIDAKITPLVDLVENDLTFHLLIARFGDLLVDTHVSYLSVPVLQNLLIGGIGVSGITLTDEGEVVITGWCRTRRRRGSGCALATCCWRLTASRRRRRSTTRRC